ncbi:hypothetical protein [Sporosarcina sp. HYO08]|uniref:hypothetical protein n=1 Tax=Sporosarcina sp. HYO08 TaxID=1759557 RepID=UPI0007994B7A|nr:hypothetical protein [Sporosarcina sp. HYO08]KXH87064.1 hypothetical protein AU377_00340 [Sporosarcina sp. HYO08]
MNEKHVLKNGAEISIRRLAPEQLKEIMALQEKVIAALTTNAILQPLSEEEFLHILQGNGQMIGAYDGNRLIAFRAMLDPGNDKEHLGIDAGLTADELSLVLYSEISNVDPAYRGNGLQQLLGKIIFGEVDPNRYRYICTTVAPYNIASLKDKFAQGMQIVSLKMKYGGKLRYILMKDLMHSSSKKGDQESHLLPMGDTEGQQRLLEDGWFGVAIEQQHGEWIVHYKK